MPPVHDHGLMNSGESTPEAGREIPECGGIGGFQKQNEPVPIFRNNGLMRALTRLPDSRLALMIQQHQGLCTSR